jgi:hypothetical protein
MDAPHMGIFFNRVSRRNNHPAYHSRFS